LFNASIPKQQKSQTEGLLTDKATLIFPWGAPHNDVNQNLNSFRDNTNTNKLIPMQKTLHLDREAELHGAIALASWR
jgi:hypothetical protein